MRRRDLDKLRRLDPKLALQLEGVLADRGTAPSPAGGARDLGRAGEPESLCQSPSKALSPGSSGALCSSEAKSVSPGGLVGSAESKTAPQSHCLSAPPASGQPRFEPKPCAAETNLEHRPFFSAEAQAGLPEVPQTLVSTEVTAEQKLAETWEGYADDCVPPEEKERRRVERVAEREAQRARDRAHNAQLGFFPGAWFRRRGTGKHVSCEQLELQLDGIERRVGRASTWDQGLSAARTMDNVEAQCFAVRELGDRPANIPECLRGLHPTLTRTQWDVLRVVVTAYMGGALGVYEYQPILASDLGMSERAFRYALNGGKNRPPGLVELGLVLKRQTWKRGVGDRPSDHHYLLLQAGPSLAELLLPVVCARRAQHGHRLPRRVGYTRSSARKSAAAARQLARQARRDRAERAIGRERRPELQVEKRPAQKRREKALLGPRNTALNCAAQTADNPVPPPTGVGGLRDRRGKPPSNPPSKNEPLRDKTLAPATPPLPKTNGSDSPTPLDQILGDRTRALDEAARHRPSNLEVWKRRRARGVQVPDEIDEALFSQAIIAARNALLGSES